MCNLIILRMEMSLKGVLLCIYISHLYAFQQTAMKTTRLLGVDTGRFGRRYTDFGDI